MSSNRLIEFLRDKFRDTAMQNRCIETSIQKITEKDCSRIFDKFPELFEYNDPRIKKLSDRLNALYVQLYKNQHEEALLLYPVESNILAWLTSIAEMGRNELFNHDRSIKFKLIQLLKWDHVYEFIDTHQLLQAYVSMVLPQVMICSRRNANFNSDEYGAIILNYSNKLSSKYIHDALYPDNDTDFSFLVPLGVTAAAAIGGLLAWSLFSDKEKENSQDEVELEDKNTKSTI